MEKNQKSEFNSKGEWKKGKKSKKKIIIPIIIAALVAGVGIFSNSTKSDSKIPAVPLGVADEMELTEHVSVLGTITGADKAEVYGETVGKITAILVKEGQLVKKGQILANVAVDEVPKKSRTEQKIELDDTKRRYDNSLMLYDADGISKEEMLQAKLAYDRALAAYNEPEADTIGDKKNIKSPISGTITRINTTVGKPSNGGTSVDGESKAPFVIEDLSKLKMLVKVSEYDIRSVALGQKVEISSEMIPEMQFEGVVSHIAPTGERHENESVIPVTIDLKSDSQAQGLIAGVSGRARILTRFIPKGLAIPTEAIRYDGDGKEYVFVYKSGKIKKVKITVGDSDSINTQIKGIKAGDKVVLASELPLVDGMEVRDENETRKKGLFGRGK